MGWIEKYMSSELKSKRSSTWDAWKLFLSSLARSYIDLFHWFRHLFFPESGIENGFEFFKKVINPYRRFFGWLHRLFFPQKGTTKVLKVMFNIETLSAFIHNLLPSQVNRSVKESAKPF